MFTAVVTVPNKTGLHARPASQLVMLSQKFKSQILLINGATEVDPKSIISILSAGIKQGTVVDVKIEGEDEQEAGEQLVAFIEGLQE